MHSPLPFSVPRFPIRSRVSSTGARPRRVSKSHSVAAPTVQKRFPYHSVGSRAEYIADITAPGFRTAMYPPLQHKGSAKTEERKKRIRRSQGHKGVLGTPTHRAELVAAAVADSHSVNACIPMSTTVSALMYERLHGRKREPERATAAGLAFDADPSAMRLNDLLGDRQAEPGCT